MGVESRTKTLRRMLRRVKADPNVEDKWDSWVNELNMGALGFSLKKLRRAARQVWGLTEP